MSNETVSVKIVGDDSGAQGAMRRAAQAVADASNLMRSKLNEVQASSRTAFNSMSREARDAGDEVIETTGRMGSAFDRLKAHFQSFTTGFAKGWRDAGNEMRQARDELGRFQSAGGKSGGFGAMEIFKGGVMLEGARKILEVGAAVVETSAEFERLRSVLLTLEGTQDAANARFDLLKKFGQETPYELSEVVTAFSKLKAQGLDPSNAALKSYGNTASAMGKSLDQMVEAVADAAMGEFERLKEFGIKASQQGDKVTFTFKGQATTVGKSASEIQAYLQKIGNTDFAGAMDRQMNTLGGKFSNLKDAAAGFAFEIGEGGLSSALKSSMDAMTGASGSSNELAHTIGAVLGASLRNFMDLIGTLRDAVSDIFSTIKGIITDAFGKSAGSAITFGNILRFVASESAVFAGTARAAFAVLTGAVQTAINVLSTFARVAYNIVTLNFSGAVAAVSDGVNRQVAIVTNGAARIQQVYGQTKARLGEIWAPPKASKAAGTVDDSGSGGSARATGGGAKGKRKGGGDSAAKKAAAEEARDERELEQDTLGVIRSIEQMEEDAARNSIELSRATLQAKLDDIAELRQAGAITARQEISQKAAVNRQIRALDVQLENAQFDAKLKALMASRLLYGQQTNEYKNYTRQIEVLRAQHEQRLALLGRQADIRERQEERQKLQQRRASLGQVAQAFGDNLARMATLQQGFGATISGIWQSIVGMVTQALAEMLAQFVLKHLLMGTVGKLLGLVDVKTNAGRAAAAAWASTAAIPIVGPAMAPAAAAAAATGALAMGATFMAKSGYDVPDLAGPGVDGRGGQMGIVHPREMVLPADIAETVRAMAGQHPAPASRDGGSASVEQHVHHWNIHAWDGRDAKRAFMDNKGAIAEALRKHVRDGGR